MFRACFILSTIIIIQLLLYRCNCYVQFNNTDLSIIEDFYVHFNSSNNSTGHDMLLSQNDDDVNTLDSIQPIQSTRWNSSNLILYIMCHDVTSCITAQKNCKDICCLFIYNICYCVV